MSEFDDIPREIASADLPVGETVLWRGRPDWRHLALDAFGAPWVALYFVGIGTWHLATALHDGASRTDALAAASAVLIPMAMALCLVAGLAWLSARATRFTLTDRRIVMCYGVALPALINVPLDTVETLRARRGFGDRGDIAFTLPRDGRLSFHQLWPYARPWHLFPATPMLRAIPKVDEVKALFLAAVAAAAERDARRAAVASDQPRPAAVPQGAEPSPQGADGTGYGEAAPAAA